MPKSRLLLAFIVAVLTQPATTRLVAQVNSDTQPKSTVRLTFSDSPVSPASGEGTSSDESVELMHEYPDCVSTDPGFPRKPLWERPGDFNGSNCMAPRYCQDEFFRAGWPLDIRKRAICSLNDHYFAWYVGGGAGLPFPKNRHRTAAEGTWGLDYSLWKKPRTVWMKWTCGRYQGGEGAYATDHEPLFHH